MKNNSLLYTVLAFLIGIGAFFVVAQILFLNSQNKMLMSQVKELSVLAAGGSGSEVVQEVFSLRKENSALKESLNKCQSEKAASANVSASRPVQPKRNSIKKADKGVWGNRGYLIKDGRSTFLKAGAQKLK